MQYFYNLSSYVLRNNIDLPWIFYLNNFFALCNNPKFWESLFSTNVLLSIQVRFSSTKTLRNFVDEDLFISLLFISKLGS